MPFFEHECQECGCRILAFQRREDPPLSTCPYCRGLLVRLMVRLANAREGERGASLPWTPLETDIHRGWKKRRKWKRDAIAEWKRGERSRMRLKGRIAADAGGGRSSAGEDD